MNRLTLNLDNQKLMEVRADFCKTSQELARLIQAAFHIKEEILGITDSSGKFYDIQYAWENLKSLSNHKLNIITSK